MALKDRLNRLRGQTGGRAPAPPEPAPEPRAGIAERVANLRPGHPAAPQRSRRIGPDQLAALLGGETVRDGVVAIERRRPLDASHGRWPLQRLVDDHGALPEAPALPVDRLLFIDTETSGLSGGSGTVAFLLGMARVEGEELVVRQLFMSSFGAEAAMLEAAGEWASDAGALVSFNGKSFDLPLIATRCRLAGVADAFSPLAHADLLHPVRRAFGSRWEDCRLASAERRLLGFERVDDLPGSEAPFAWFDYLQRGNPGRLEGVIEHNHWDLLSLALLLPALGEVHRAPAAYDADLLALARVQRRQGRADSGFQLLHAHAGALGAAAKRELAAEYRRRGRWTEALALWEELAREGCTNSLGHLAKYYEHVGRDLERALAYARRLPGGSETAHRVQRLEKKLAALGGVLPLGR